MSYVGITVNLSGLWLIPHTGTLVTHRTKIAVFSGNLFFRFSRQNFLSSWRQMLFLFKGLLNITFGQGLSVQGLHVLLPQSKTMQIGVRLTGDSKLTVECKWFSLCLLALRYTVATCRLQLELAPARPSKYLKQYRKMDSWKDGWFNSTI